MLTKEAVEEYKAIHKRVFNKELTDDEAYGQSLNLLTLYKTIYAVSTEKHSKKKDE